MAVLRNAATGASTVLLANHWFGRSAERADTCLPDTDISSAHATIQWRERRWWLTDYSRNGSFIDGQRQPRGEAVPLRARQVLRFGAGLNGTWQVQDLEPPASALVPLEPGAEPLLLTSSNVLPHGADLPQLSIYQAVNGSWMLEEDGELRELADGDLLQVAGVRYRLQMAQLLDETEVLPRSAATARLHLSFHLSLDEEHAFLLARTGTGSVDLGERTHHYCLVTLARRKLADAQAGLEEAAQGWVSCAALAKMLGTDVQHLNIQIFRARNQLMQELPGVAQVASIVERRRGELRFGPFAFDITRGSQAEGAYPTDPVVSAVSEA